MVRHKNRYVLVRVVWAAPADPSIEPRKTFPVSGKPLIDALFSSLSAQYGAYGRGVLRRSYALKVWSPESGYAIVRAARDWSAMAVQCVRSISVIDGTAASLKIEHVGGSIHSCVKHAATSARDELLRLSQNVQA